MHSVLGVRHFIVQVLIWETQGVCSVVSEVVGVHLVVMEEHPTVQVLREEIESQIKLKMTTRRVSILPNF